MLSQPINLADAMKARKFYPLADRRSRAIQAVRYAQALAYLGDKWLLIKKSNKLAELRPV